MTGAPAAVEEMQVDGRATTFVTGDSVAVALIRAGDWPGRGGTLCLAGDCGNCLGIVDGVAYVRTCQVPARAGLVVEHHPVDGLPPLPAGATAPSRDVRVRHEWVDVATIGEPSLEFEPIAVYPGPAVVGRDAEGIRIVHAKSVAVDAGAAELHPLETPGVPRRRLTRNAAEALAEAGIDVATIADVDVVDLGTTPRDALARMAPSGSIVAVGEAAAEHDLPPTPTDPAAVLCPCMSVTVGDLDEAWSKGFTEIELLKRATLAGIGTCQGGVCLPHLRSYVAGRTGTVPPPFTARPGWRQVTVGEAAADVHVDAFRRTPLHDEHLALGGRMDRFGGWWRPWNYGDAVAEYWAVRERVSLGDVSTLGKLVVSGPDVVEALERLYPCHVADLKPGRSRYALLLNERGHVMDDGMILRDGERRFTLTFTSGGAANAEMWVRDWIDEWGLRVHVLDQTMSLAAINVTGPLATELLARAGLTDPPRYLGHARCDVAGVPCHVMRLSFTGEASFELHHPVDASVDLWRALSELGSDLGVAPHGLQALFGLRLEKGHVIIGMDTELDTTPRRLGMDWAVRMEKPFFLGRASLERTAKLPDDRRWFGFAMDGPAPAEGSPIRSGGAIVGQVTGSWTSPLLDRALMLGWQRRQPFVERVEIDGREAVVTPTPFYDPEGVRARA
ncbi:MAG: 2Fe-2S iron-sulfur cluster-binding protein [Chloroflexota bacterium]